MSERFLVRDDAESFIKQYLHSAQWEGERLIVSFEREALIEALVEGDMPSPGSEVIPAKAGVIILKIVRYALTRDCGKVLNYSIFLADTVQASAPQLAERLRQYAAKNFGTEVHVASAPPVADGVKCGLRVSSAFTDGAEYAAQIVEELEELQFGKGAYAPSGQLRERLAATAPPAEEQERPLR